MSSSHTRRWDIENPNEQIRATNKELSTRLLQIVTRRNLNVHLARYTPSISELVDVLATNKVIPREQERKSREYADAITRIGDRVDRGEVITPDEFQQGDYTLAIVWFDSILPDIER